MSVTKWTLPLLFVIVNTAFADGAPTKSYTLADLKNVSSADTACNQVYTSLQQLAKRPITLQFANNKDQAAYDVKNNDNQIMNHSYKIVRQTSSETMVNRTGIGSFELDHNKMDYVLQISVDTKHDDHHYAYPMIISDEQSHCVFTGLLKPDQKTLSMFKKNIHDKKLEKGQDLTSQ